MEVLSESDVFPTADSIGRERKMRIIQNAMEAVLVLLLECELKGFSVIIMDLGEYRYILLLLSYFRNILKQEDMYAVLYGVAVKRPSVRCTVTGDNLTSVQIASTWPLKDVEMV